MKNKLNAFSSILLLLLLLLPIFPAEGLKGGAGPSVSISLGCRDVHVFRILFLFYNTSIQSVSSRSVNKVIERLDEFTSFFRENTGGSVVIMYEYIIINRTILKEEMASTVQGGQIRYWVDPSTIRKDVEKIGKDLSSYDAIIVYYGIRWPYVAHGGISYGAKGFFGETGFISIPIAPDEEPISDKYSDFLIEVAIHEFLHVIDNMYELMGDNSFYNPDEMSKWTSYTRPYDYYVWMLRNWPVKKWFNLKFGFNAKNCSGKIYVSVTFTGEIPATKIKVDGSYLPSNGSIWVEIGNHELSADKEVMLYLKNGTLVRYSFSKWIIGSRTNQSNPLAILVDRPLNISIECKTLTFSFATSSTVDEISVREVFRSPTFSPNGSIVVGGPLANKRSEIAALSSGIKFGKNWMEINGTIYRSTWGKVDYAVIIVKDRIYAMGTHRYGTKAALLLLLEGIDFRFLVIKWVDLNSNGDVEREEISILAKG